MTVEAEGNTLDEAIEAALEKLGVAREEAQIEVLEEDKKGFLGMGSSKARVRASKAPSAADGVEKTVALIKDIMKCSSLEGTVELKEELDSININIAGEDLGLLIGKRGETLGAIQTIANVVLRKSGTDKKLIIDVENYRKRREQNLVEIAKQAAERAVRSRRAVFLEPMNSYDRRTVHLALQENNSVVTVSEGEEPDRLVKIEPKL